MRRWLRALLLLIASSVAASSLAPIRPDQPLAPLGPYEYVPTLFNINVSDINGRLATDGQIFLTA